MTATNGVTNIIHLKNNVGQTRFVGRPVGVRVVATGKQLFLLRRFDKGAIFPLMNARFRISNKCSMEIIPEPDLWN